MLRVLATIVLISAITTPASAADLAQAARGDARQTSGGEQAKPAEQHASDRIRTAEIWAGAALIATGAYIALYGFGNPSGPVDNFNPAQDTFPRRTGLGVSGIVIAAAGGVLAWHGLMHTSVAVGPHAFSIQHRVTF